MKKLKATLTPLLIALLFVAVACQQDSVTEQPILVSNMNTEISPGDDFYRFVNAGWLENNPIPEEYSRYGSFEQLAEQNEDKLYDLLQTIRNDQSAVQGSNRQKVRDFFNSAMDTVTQAEHGVNAIAFLLDDIDNINDKNELPRLLARLHLQGFGPVFGLRAAQDRKNTEEIIANIYQGGLGMSDRDYYLKDDARSTEIRENYEIFVENIFKLAGQDEEAAASAREVIMEIETRFADASMTRLERRDPYATYNKMTVVELDSSMDAFNWQDYLSALGIEINDLNVGQPAFFERFNQLAETQNLEQWKTYLKWNVLRGSAPYIGQEFEQAHFDFYSRVMTGSAQQRERWKIALSTLNGALGDAVGQEYVALHFPPESKDRMVELVEYLREAFHQRIEQLEWMGPDTKENAFAKLEAMNVKIGYPDKWVDYSELEIKEQPHVMNVIASREFNIARNLEEIGQPVDRDKWFMNPQTVNAYYSPTMNEIVFPAAILQPPFFFPDGDDAVNFGAIGMVIGHEMTHGFDDQGRRYALDGNLEEWWTEEDSRQFEEKTTILIDQYNNYVMLDTLTINGKLSLGENIADLGGLTIAFQALQNKLTKDGNPGDIDGFTPKQRFFIAYGQIWRNHMRDQRMMQQLSEGPHSPGEARVNGIVYNMKEFYEAFDLDATNASRYIETSARAEIW